MRLPRMLPCTLPTGPAASGSIAPRGRGAIVPQSSLDYFDSQEQCICVHAADSAAMNWNPTSKDAENDAAFRQRLNEFCDVAKKDIHVDKGMKGHPYYIYLDDRRCYVYANGTTVCGDARHERGPHGMMDDPATVDCGDKFRQFASDYKRKY